MMTSASLRALLAASVSVTAFALAAPALAQTASEAAEVG